MNVAQATDLAGDRFGDFYTSFHWGEVSNMVDNAWKKVGIRSYTDYLCGNSYYLNGRRITREEAYQYAADKLGRKKRPISLRILRS